MLPRQSSPPTYLSTVQAARALGVSVTTVKRWVDDGILPAHRTAGGHRKLLRSEVIALCRQGVLPHGDLGVLTAPGAGQKAADTGAIADGLFNALSAGRGADASAIIQGAYASGVAIETLADRVIAPVMAKVGHQWEVRRIDVWHEHRATQLCAEALFRLKEQLEARAERGRPIAVGGAPEGDPYLLPTLLAGLVLLDAGWEVVQLGPNTPLPSVARAVRELRPRLVWLSVSYQPNVTEFTTAYRRLYELTELEGIALAVGGQALLADAVRSTIPYTTYGDGLAHLAAFARTLHPRRRPRRRGRPARHA